MASGGRRVALCAGRAVGVVLRGAGRAVGGGRWRGRAVAWAGTRAVGERWAAIDIDLV